MTSGGLRGTIVALKDDYIQLRVPPDNLRIEVTRASVVSVADPRTKLRRHSEASWLPFQRMHQTRIGGKH